MRTQEVAVRAPALARAGALGEFPQEAIRVAFRDEVPREAQTRPSRRGERVNSRIPVVLEWEDASGTTRRAEAHTRVVNFYGCLLVSAATIATDQRFQLTNTATQRIADAVLVWRGKERSEGCEMGVELLDPEMDFWGLEL